MSPVAGIRSPFRQYIPLPDVSEGSEPNLRRVEA